MIGVCEERRRSQNEAIKGHFIFGTYNFAPKGVFLLPECSAVQLYSFGARKYNGS